MDGDVICMVLVILLFLAIIILPIYGILHGFINYKESNDRDLARITSVTQEQTLFRTYYKVEVEYLTNSPTQNGVIHNYNIEKDTYYCYFEDKELVEKLQNNMYTEVWIISGRKGGYETVVYFGDEVADALLDYLEKRSHIIPLEGHEQALFLSMQNRRITVRAVQNLVKKYASLVTTLKKITPHKLRSTYGTSLYRETGDIYLVADVLGHKDVNTTRKHYAAIEDERRRSAANKVRLREP